MSFLEVLTAVGSAVAATTVILAGAWRLLRPHFRAAVQDVREGKRAAQDARRQLHPNGGESLRDCVDELSVQVTGLSTAVEKLTGEDRVRAAEMVAIREGVRYTGRALDTLAETVDKLQREASA